MWPWEHVLLAYLVYSVYRHLRTNESPSGPPTIALVLGSLFPDVVDKPLAWEFAVFSSGYSIAHSIFVAIPLSFLVVYVAHRWGRPRIGIAFGFGYLLHLVGDVIPISLAQGEVYIAHLLWPVVRSSQGRPPASLRSGVRYHFDQYLVELGSMDPSIALVVQLGVVAIGCVIWAIDGFPGLDVVVHQLWRSIRVMFPTKSRR